jgi:broad specificity phosphatase PhoE
MSSLKNIYFIRHGESEGNVGPVRQDADSPLTERGRRQAEYMAKRCLRLPIDCLISSDMVRAQETATIIGEIIGKEVEISDLFAERERPSIQTGQPKDDPATFAIDRVIWDNFAVPGFRHSDEENFDDLKVRAEQALEYLANRPEQHIAVVTHGLFLRIVMASVVFKEQLTGKECERFMRTLSMENTGLSILRYDGADAEPPWRIWVWNDHAHLG